MLVDFAVLASHVFCIFVFLYFSEIKFNVFDFFFVEKGWMVWASSKVANARLAFEGKGNFPFSPLVGDQIGNAHEVEIGNFGGLKGGRGGGCGGVGHARR